jgi:hypothetical protein
VTKVSVVVVSAIVVLQIGCGQTRFVEAAQCFVVDVKNGGAHKLASYVDAFALTNGLTPDRQPPQMTIYTLYVEGGKAGLVSYAPGASEQGAQLALYRFDSPRSKNLAHDFTELMNRQIRPLFGVKTCAEVPDVGMPSASQ